MRHRHAAVATCDLLDAVKTSYAEDRQRGSASLSFGVRRLVAALALIHHVEFPRAAG
ncbi:MAG: hypothetical protein R3C20_08945 [Planctomycetaceae bacterium]